MFKVILLLGCLIVISIYAEELRDPTQPIKIDAETQAMYSGSPTINSIMIFPTKKTVMIGSHTLTIGDKIMGKKIIAIEPHSIKLEIADGNIITISIFKTILKAANSNNGDEK